MKLFLKILLPVVGLVVIYVAMSMWYVEEAFEEITEACDDVVDPILIYGFNVDTLAVSTGIIAQNQSLSQILDPFGISSRKIFEIAEKSKPVFDVRKLRAGTPYVIIHTKGKPVARQFIFEPNNTEFVVYNLTDSIYAKTIAREVEIVERTVAGEISSSLWASAVQSGASPALVDKLVDVFAWQIDFFRIQRGDKFKVIYDEQVVNGKPVGIGRVQAAWLEHFGKPFYAIYFDDCGTKDYYDECGNSVRRAFLKAPLNYTRISSRYSLNRFHPILKINKAHLGTDYSAPTGTPIYSVGSGVILEAQYKGGNGNYVKVKHNSTYTTQYLHMSKIATGIRPGVHVSQGQVIGYVGSTGLSTGPHLCFRFWKNGQQVDPFKVELPPSKPVDVSAIWDYYHHRDEVVRKLDSVNIESSEVRMATMPD
jgi:murein DD-endopeptidase MepM/ murein hydrolase activator NlpD